MTLEDQIEILADVAMFGLMNREKIEPAIDRAKILATKLEALLNREIEDMQALEYLFKKYGV